MGRQDRAVRGKESSGYRDQERLSGGQWKKREGRRDGVTGEELQEQQPETRWMHTMNDEDADLLPQLFRHTFPDLERPRVPRSASVVLSACHRWS